MKKENAIRYYRKFSGADMYMLGFIYHHELYIAEVKEIMPRWIKVERASSSKGGHEKLQLRMKKAHMEELIRKGAKHIGSEELILGKGNKGDALENLVYELNGITRDTTHGTDRFDKCGDININGVEVQIKLNGAQIVEFRTLNKIQKERRLGLA